jgi:4'-phosphopantetheinyl transferase EntD
MIAFGPRSPALSDSLGAAIQALLPDGASGAYADPSETPGPLAPAEAAGVSRAVAARQEEFARGRWCARRALTELGIAEAVLPIGSDRAPVWPPGVVGSITHCDGFVGAVVALRGLVQSVGFDVEPASRLRRDLVPFICTPAETAWVEEARSCDAVVWPKVLFSAKEAIHKCVWPLSGIMLDFRDVTVAVAPSRGTFAARLNVRSHGGLPDFARISGRFAVTSHFVLTSAFIGAPALPA